MVSYAFGPRKKKHALVKVLEAYSQKTIPGIPHADVKEATHFIILWGGSSYPETFFWRGEHGWLTCSMMKAHRIATLNVTNERTSGYSSEWVTADKIHIGDTLMVTPVPGGKFPVPAEVSPETRNTLFYKTGGSGWLSIGISQIVKKPDVVMP